MGGGPPVEVLQHGGVGPLEEPLLAGRRRVAGAHEDAALGGAAVDAAVADGVVEALILPGDSAAQRGGWGGGKKKCD